MEQRKNQFIGFVVILLSVGFLNYFRKISTGYKLTKTGKILYLMTMVTFTVSILFVLYFTKLNNIASFLLGLGVTILSEHIAKFFLKIGNNFNPIIVKVIKKFTGLDLSEEILNPESDNEETIKKRNKK